MVDLPAEKKKLGCRGWFDARLSAGRQKYVKGYVLFLRRRSGG